MYIYVYVCMCIYVHIYTHTQTITLVRTLSSKHPVFGILSFHLIRDIRSNNHSASKYYWSSAVMFECLPLSLKCPMACLLSFHEVASVWMSSTERSRIKERVARRGSVILQRLPIASIPQFPVPQLLKHNLLPALFFFFIHPAASRQSKTLQLTEQRINREIQKKFSSTLMCIGKRLRAELTELYLIEILAFRQETPCFYLNVPKTS